MQLRTLYDILVYQWDFDLLKHLFRNLYLQYILLVTWIKNRFEYSIRKIRRLLDIGKREKNDFEPIANKRLIQSHIDNP